MLTATILPISTTWLECGLAILLAMFLLIVLPKSRGTTLTAPCLWAIISALCLVFFAMLEKFSPAQSITRDAFRFTVVVSTFCPLMAVLGAKRPQNRGWQWIVLSLWAITIWPAVQAALLPASNQLELYIVWKLFLVGLIVIGLLNYLPTRFMIPSLLVASGQFLLLDRYLWNSFSFPNHFRYSLVCFFAALVFARLLATNSKQRTSLFSNNKLSTHELTWLNFRNAYGAFWALRILARVNETAELRQWPFRLTWAGFDPHPHDTDIAPTETHLAELDQTFAILLRRFNKLPDESSS